MAYGSTSIDVATVTVPVRPEVLELDMVRDAVDDPVLLPLLEAEDGPLVEAIEDLGVDSEVAESVMVSCDLLSVDLLCLLSSGSGSVSPGSTGSASPSEFTVKGQCHRRCQEWKEDQLDQDT